MDSTALAHTPTAPTRGALRRHLAFYEAALLIAGHVVDDSWLQPADGTTASDHVVSGLVPLAVIALGVWAYPKVRAGARGLIAVALGLFGLIVGIEAAYYTVQLGPSGDDGTGLLAIAAGAVLIVIGAVVLWRSRRRTPNPWWRQSRRVLLGVAGAVAMFELVFPVAVAYMATHVARAVVPADELGVAHEDVTLRTSDGLSLQGWYVPSENGAAVIAFAGRKGTQQQARMLIRHGYGVLLFDRRGEGASEGDGNMFGWDGQRDIVAALDFLEQRPDVDPTRIGGIGLSVGGELMLQTAAQDDRLAAVVTEGAGTRSIAEELEEYHGLQLASLLPFVAMKTAAVAVFSNGTPPPKLTDLVPEIAPRPSLFIWASTLSDIETMNPTYHRLAGANSSIWELDDAEHVRGLATHPVQYEDRVVGFFDAALSRP